MRTSTRRSRRHRNPNQENRQQNEPFFSPAETEPKQTKAQAFFQPKLTIGQPGDPYEQEADTVAQQVVNGPADQAPAVQRKKISGIQRMATPEEEKMPSTNDARMRQDKLQPKKEDELQTQQDKELQPKKEDELQMQRDKKLQPKKEDELQMQQDKKLQPKKEDELQMQQDKELQPKKEDELRKQEDKELQTKSAGAPTQAGAHLSSRLDSAKGRGKPMPADTQARMEGAIGADFSTVNIHTDTESAQMNRELGAQAFTHGQDIYFGAGKYDPNSSKGQELLAHELTHTVQQGAAARRRIDRKTGDPTTNPTKYWYIVKDSAWLRYKTSEGTFEPLYSGKVATGGAALLDENDAFKPTDQKISAGAEVQWYLPAAHPGLAKVISGEKQGWVKKTGLKGKIVTPPVQSRIEMLEQAAAAGGAQPVYYNIKWKDYEGWTSVGNVDSKTFDLTNATPVAEAQKEQTLTPDRGTSGSKAARKKSRQAYQKGAPEAYMTTSTLSTVFKVARINNNKATIRQYQADKNTFTPTTDTLKNKKWIIVLDEKTVDEKMGKKDVKSTYARVMDFAGNEYWTSSGNYTYQSASPGNLPEITSDKVRAALEAIYSKAVVDLLAAKKGFSKQQQTLFETARKFLTDGALQAQYPDVVQYNALDLAREGNTLNADLRQRLDVFYKFLQYQKLIFSGKVTASDGVRSASEAHRWSTAYNIRMGNIGLSRLQQLTGGKDKDGNLWYNPTTDDVFKDVALSAAEVQAELEKQKADPNYKIKTTKKVLDETATMVNIVARATGYWDGALAAEGYPGNDERRLPNLTTVGVSNHITGNAVDITFPFTFNYFDPVIDALAAIFGLFRAVREGGEEYWHYERLGMPAKGQMDQAESK